MSNPTTNTSNEATSKLLSHEELGKQIAAKLVLYKEAGISGVRTLREIMALINSQKQAWADKEVKAVLDEIEKESVELINTGAKVVGIRHIQSIRRRYE